MSHGMQPHLQIKPVSPAGPGHLAVLDGAPAVLDPGTGGWVVVERPKRVGVTDWAGLIPNQMMVPLMFDGWARQRSVERNVERLEALMRRPTKQTKRPAVVRLEGPVPYTSVRWVLNGITYREQLRRSSDGARVRVQFDALFLQYIPADIMVESKKSPAKAAAERSTAPASSKVYTVKAGDTLSGIARTHLGDPNRWQEIASLNGIRDPRRIQIGQQVRIP